MPVTSSSRSGAAWIVSNSLSPKTSTSSFAYGNHGRSAATDPWVTRQTATESLLPACRGLSPIDIVLVDRNCACGVDLLQPYPGDSEPANFAKSLTNCSTSGTNSAGTRGPLILSG